MSRRPKDIGTSAEREVAALLSDLLGFRVRRKLGAGRADDTGDLDGIPDTTQTITSGCVPVAIGDTTPIVAVRLVDGHPPPARRRWCRMSENLRIGSLFSGY